MSSTSKWQHDLQGQLRHSSCHGQQGRDQENLGPGWFSSTCGAEFANKTDALRYYGQVASSAIVVKPKSTNFGLGISIFQEPEPCGL